MRDIYRIFNIFKIFFNSKVLNIIIIINIFFIMQFLQNLKLFCAMRVFNYIVTIIWFK